MGQRLGTPISGNLINCFGYKVTGIDGLGTNVATFLGNALPSAVVTFLGTPSSANLRAALTDETGTGAAVFANSPTLVTPALGAATATSINSVTLDNNAWSTYTPTLAAQTGTPTTTATQGRYKQIGKTVFAQFFITVTTVGTAAGQMQVGLPVTVVAGAGNNFSGTCYNTDNNKSGGAVAVPGSSICVSLDATGTTWWASGQHIAGTLIYEAA